MALILVMRFACRLQDLKFSCKILRRLNLQKFTACYYLYKLYSFTIMETSAYFKGVKDRYSGLTVSSAQEYISAEKLDTVLKPSLDQWKNDGIRAVWFKVDIQHSEWVPVLAKYGFVYHHAQADFVMMVQWISPNEPNNLPGYAHNMIGVGAFVVNDKDELLVVRERFYTKPHWKLPGGYVNPGEDLRAAAVREVKEETGVDAKFMSMVSFRHVHKANFNCSDIYFIIHLKPVSENITMCKNELAACEWMKLQDYISHPDVHEVNKKFASCFLESRSKGVQIEAIDIFSAGLNRTQTVYSFEYGKKSDRDIKPNGQVQSNNDPKL